MERLKNIKNTLITSVQGQMSSLDCVDAEELGEVVDMIKDIEEAIYYCTITKAMEEQGDGEESIKNFNTRYPYYYRDVDRDDGRMYYTEREYNNDFPMEKRDSREGRSPLSRKMYMESKELHKDSMQPLEKYMHELTDDVMDMIKEATPEEKQVLKNKMSLLVQKIV